jgi:hypothetical protein
MPPRKHGDQELLDHFMLTDDHLAKLARKPVIGLAQVLNIVEVVVAEHISVFYGLLLSKHPLI